MSCLIFIIAFVIAEAIEFGFSWFLVIAASKAFGFDYTIWHVVFTCLGMNALSAIFRCARPKNKE